MLHFAHLCPWWKRATTPPATPYSRGQAEATLPLRRAYLCLTCATVCDRAPRGVCRSCGSTAVHSLSRILQHYQAQVVELTTELVKVNVRVAEEQQAHAPAPRTPGNGRPPDGVPDGGTPQRRGHANGGRLDHLVQLTDFRR